MRYLLAILILFGWHHHKKHGESVTMTIVPDADRTGCDLDAHGIKWYLGEDGMIGFGVTCEDAYQSWRNTQGPRIRHAS